MRHDTRSSPLQTRKSPLPVRLRVQRDHTACVDIGDVIRKIEEGSLRAGHMLVECFLKMAGHALVQVFTCRISLAHPASVHELCIPLSVSRPATLFILCHGPEQQMVQLWKRVEP
jgi:hypothetical protein